jgi:hypothetical protein
MKAETETFHWIKTEDYNNFQKGVDVKSACGEQVVRGMRFCTAGNLPVINCENCKNKYNEFIKSRTQKLCSFCSTPLRDEDYNNSNDFYLSCFQHKRLAQTETEKFFQENPDYTKL